MTYDEMISAVNAEISRLQQVKELLGKPVSEGAIGYKDTKIRQRRPLSSETRLLISQAQKLRWAKQKGKATSAREALEKSGVIEGDR